MMTNDDILGLLAEAVRSGSGIRVAVSGRSMGPSYAAVSEIEVIPCNPAAINLGRLVVFQRDGCWVVHRVMRRSQGPDGVVYLTKGDGLNRPDRPAVKSSEIKGVVSSLGLKDGSRVDLLSFLSRLQSLWIVIRYWIGHVILPTGRAPGPVHQE